MKIREHYTWDSHAATYMQQIQQLIEKVDTSEMEVAVPSDPIGRRLAKLNYFLITDIDNTLIGDDNSKLEELIQLLMHHRETIGFGVATGRTVESAHAYLEKFGIHAPDVTISSVGSEIYYGPYPHPQRRPEWPYK